MVKRIEATESCMCIACLPNKTSTFSVNEVVLFWRQEMLVVCGMFICELHML